MTDVFTALVEARVLPLVRAPSDAEAAELVGRHVDRGMSPIELTTTTRGWRDLPVELCGAHPVGVGVGAKLAAEDRPA